jgi:hypothetical protein
VDIPEEINRTCAYLYPNKSQDIARKLSQHKNGIVGKTSTIYEDGEVYNEKEVEESLQTEQVFHN